MLDVPGCGSILDVNRVCADDYRIQGLIGEVVHGEYATGPVEHCHPLSRPDLLPFDLRTQQVMHHDATWRDLRDDTRVAAARSAAAKTGISVGARVGVAAQPPDVLAGGAPEAPPVPSLLPRSTAELPSPLPLPLDDVLSRCVDAAPDDALVADVPSGVQHSSSAGPGQSPGVET